MPHDAQQPGKREPYGIEPEDAAAPETPPDPGAESAPAAPPKPSLLEGFDEDEDFDRDPEVERALRPPRPAPAPGEPAPAERPPIARPGVLGAKATGIAGLIVLAGALTAAGYNAPARPFARAGITLYDAALQTGAGIIAVLLAALFTERRFSRLDLVAARMFLAVTVFQLVFHLEFGLVAQKIEESVVAAAAYLAVVWGFFRADVRTTGMIGLANFLLWGAVYLGMFLRTSLVP